MKITKTPEEKCKKHKITQKGKLLLHFLIIFETASCDINFVVCEYVSDYSFARLIHFRYWPVRKTSRFYCMQTPKVQTSLHSPAVWPAAIVTRFMIGIIYNLFHANIQRTLSAQVG